MKTLIDYINKTLKKFPKKICFNKARKFEGKIDLNRISAKGHTIKK